jgi:hypothetical protein
MLHDNRNVIRVVDAGAADLVSRPRSPSHLAGHAGDQQATENKELEQHQPDWDSPADVALIPPSPSRASNDTQDRNHQLGQAERARDALKRLASNRKCFHLDPARA